VIASRVVAWLGGVSIVIGCVAAPAGAQDPPRRYDVVLLGGSVHIGDGSEPVVANVAIDDGRIAAIGPQAMEAGLVLDCKGLVVCPGFIDLHNHSDGPILGKLTRSNVNYLLQGCTTVVTGNCGSGPVDVGAYLQKIDDQGAGTHIAHLLPQGSLRDDVMGKANRKPTDEELAKMRDLADKAMQDGAFGMSTGLIYIPGIFTETEELIEIAKVVAKHDGIYASHIRGEGKTLVDAVQEAIRIGQEAGTPTHISHFKASGKPYWGTLRLAIQLVEAARTKGLTVTADQYPYIASSTSLDATLLPGWAREGGRPDLKKRLEEAETFQRIRSEVADKLQTSSRIQIASCGYRPAWVGKSIQEIAAADGKEVVDVVMEIEKNGGAAIVNFGMSEDDVRSAMPLPWVATASDGGPAAPAVVRDVPAQDRALCDRRECAVARGGDPQLVGAAGGNPGPGRPRAAQGRAGGGRCGVRSEDVPGPGDVRAAGPADGGDPARARGGKTRGVRRAGDGSAGGARAAEDILDGQGCVERR
jgi:N-acyl-D-amino-acid deacylase